MKKTLILVLLVLCAAAAFAGEMSDGKSDGMSNDRSFLGRWRWTGLTAATKKIDTGENADNYLITFDEDGTFRVKADCRQGNGTYVANNGVLTLNFNAMNNTSCEAGSFAAQMVELLENGTFEYEFTADTKFYLKFAAGVGKADFLKTNDAL